jgi:D-alanine transaminase
MNVFLNGDFLPEAEARISPNDRGFMFADGVYEVIHSYDGYLFRTESHRRRLERSLSELKIGQPDGFDLSSVAKELLARNGLEQGEAIVYLQITRGVAPRAHPFPENSEPTIYGFAQPYAPPLEQRSSGCSMVTVPDQRWLRCDIKSLSLLPNVMAKQAAVDSGAYESLLVRDGNVTEGSSSNFAAFFNNQLVTAPLNNLILPGITREVVLELCKNLQIPVAEEFIPAASLYAAEEAMMLSSTVEVVPVVELDGKKVGTGKPGPHTRRIQEAFRMLVKQDKALNV